MKRIFGVALTGIALGAGWVALTSMSTGTAIATWAPCPRNWAWTPTYLPRTSPLRSHSFRIGKAHAKVCYGSPSLRGRTMIGSSAVPYGEIWRTGANEPTTLHLDRAVRVGELTLGAGSYSIYTLPGPREWTVIFNRATHQWGLESEYTEEIASREVGRILVRARTPAAQVEELVFRTEPSATGAVDLLFEWQQTQVRIPIESEFVHLEPGDESGDSSSFPSD